MSSFYGNRFLAPIPNSKPVDHPLSAARDYLFNILVDHLCIYRSSSPPAIRRCAMIGPHITYNSAPHCRLSLSPNSSSVAPRCFSGFAFDAQSLSRSCGTVHNSSHLQIVLLSGSLSRQVYCMAISHRMGRPVTVGVLSEMMKWMLYTLKYLSSVSSSSLLQTTVVLYSFTLSS